MRFGLLGALEVSDDACAPVDVGGRQPRTLLAMLLVAAGRPVPVDAIIDTIWPTGAPTSAIGTLQSYVSRLRRRLGDAAPLPLGDTGYRLDVPADRVDMRTFEVLAEEGHALLTANRPAEAAEVLLAADALWRGPALVEFLDHDFAKGTAERLEERRLSALEDRIAAQLALGRHAVLVGELAELTGLHPLRETLQAQRALALYRSGRQADALRVLAEAGRTLREELGVEPSRPLRELEASILAHDPSLDAPVTAHPPAPEGARPVAEPHATDTSPPAVPSPAVPPAGSTSDLVGRDYELAELVAALAEAKESSRFFVVEGDPGIGKTRLLDELRVLAEQQGALVVWGRSDEGGAAPALWPWLPPLRALAAHVGPLPITLDELLRGDTPLARVQAPDAQFERFLGIADLFEQCAQHAQVLVLLDDLQWADAASLELLTFLAARLERGVLIAMTLRRLEVGRNDEVTDALAAVARRRGSRRLQLRGLSEDATSRMLSGNAWPGVSPEVAAAIHTRSEGNPFYAIELARLLVDEGRAEAEVPASVGDVVRRRLARLPEATVALLGVGAVVGRDIELGLLARAAGETLDNCLDTIEPAVVHRLLIEVPDQPSVFRFSHALVREVLLEDLSALRRARLHLKVADAIEAGTTGVDDAEILAEHLWRAAPVGVGLRAADALERAADVALRRVAFATAEELLSKAVQLRRAAGTTDAHHEGELDGICRLLEVVRARRYFQATDVALLNRAKELAERCNQRDTLLEIMWFEWSAHATSCRRETGTLLARQMRALTESDPSPEVRAIAHEVWGVRCWADGRITESLAELTRAQELHAVAPEPSHPFAVERRMNTDTFVLFDKAIVGVHTVDETCAGFDAMLAAQPDRFSVATVCGFAATTAVALGEWLDAERYATIGSEADVGSQFMFWRGQALMQRAIVAAWKGDADSALQLFEEGRNLYTGVGGRSALVTFTASLAMNLARIGSDHLDDANGLLAAARAELETYRELWNEPVLLIAEGVVAHAAGDDGRARSRFDEAAATATAQGAHALARRAAATAALMER